MAREMDDEGRFNRNVLYSVVITGILLLILPMYFVVGKPTALSALCFRYRSIGLLFDICLVSSSGKCPINPISSFFDNI